jgi:ketosteroid isomerase-like protein
MQQKRVKISTIGNVVKKLDQAVNNKNLEETLNYYEDEALLVMQPCRVAKGKSEIRDFFKYIFEIDTTASQITTNVMETGDIALFTSRWIAEGRTPD